MALIDDADDFLNFFPMKDEEIVKRWTIDELDMLHDISGLGRAWQASERRKKLQKLENDAVDDLNL